MQPLPQSRNNGAATAIPPWLLATSQNDAATQRETARKRLARARTRLMMARETAAERDARFSALGMPNPTPGQGGPRYPWYAALCMKLAVDPSRPHPSTMGTDGTRLFFNAPYVATLTDNQLLGGFAHELKHAALCHPHRLGKRDPKLANKAADLVINSQLIEEGFELPPGCLLDDAFRGLSFEVAYARLAKAQRDQEEQERQTPPPPADCDEETSDDESDESDEESDDDSDSDQESDDESGDDGTGDDESDTDESADDVGSDADQESDDAGDTDESADGSSGGDESDDDATDQESDDAGEESDEYTDTQPQFMAPEESPADDAGKEPDHTNDLTPADWQIAAAQAMMAARKAGNMPAGLQQEVTESRDPRADWRAVLRRFIEQTIPSDYSWTELSRTYLPLGIYLPGLTRRNAPAIGVWDDTSGSTSRMAPTFAAELNAILKEVRPESLEIVYCDCAVQKVETYTPDGDDEIKLIQHGGGGTAAQPALDYFNNLPTPPACVIAFTDLYLGDTPTEPDYPVLWCIPEGGSTAPAPFGERVTMAEYE